MEKRKYRDAEIKLRGHSEGITVLSRLSSVCNGVAEYASLRTEDAMSPEKG
jgi:hypothetical protein